MQYLVINIISVIGFISNKQFHVSYKLYHICISTFFREFSPQSCLRAHGGVGNFCSKFNYLTPWQIEDNHNEIHLQTFSILVVPCLAECEFWSFMFGQLFVGLKITEPSVISLKPYMLFRSISITTGTRLTAWQCDQPPIRSQLLGHGEFRRLDGRRKVVQANLWADYELRWETLPQTERPEAFSWSRDVTTAAASQSLCRIELCTNSVRPGRSR